MRETGHNSLSLIATILINPSPKTNFSTTSNKFAQPFSKLPRTRSNFEETCNNYPPLNPRSLSSKKGSLNLKKKICPSRRLASLERRERIFRISTRVSRIELIEFPCSFVVAGYRQGSSAQKKANIRRFSAGKQPSARGRGSNSPLKRGGEEECDGAGG